MQLDERASTPTAGSLLCGTVRPYGAVGVGVQCQRLQSGLPPFVWWVGFPRGSRQVQAEVDGSVPLLPGWWALVERQGFLREAVQSCLASRPLTDAAETRLVGEDSVLVHRRRGRRSSCRGGRLRPCPRLVGPILESGARLLEEEVASGILGRQPDESLTFSCCQFLGSDGQRWQACLSRQGLLPGQLYAACDDPGAFALLLLLLHPALPLLGRRRRRVDRRVGPPDTPQVVDDLASRSAEHIGQARVDAPAPAAGHLVGRAV